MNIGLAIETVRKKRRLTQTELSKRVGITQASMHNIESGKKKPHKSTLLKICESLNITEPLLNLLSMSEEDVPDYGRKQYRLVESKIKELIISTLK